MSTLKKGKTLSLPKGAFQIREGDKGEPKLEKKKKVCLAVHPGGRPIYIYRNKRGSKPRLISLITLTDFEIKNSRVSWRARTQRGEIFEGGARMVQVPGTYIRMTPKIPITLHKRTAGWAPEFVLEVDHRDSVTIWKPRG